MPDTTTLTRDWLTRQQAADYLQVHVFTIDRWIKAGRLKASQLVAGGTVRIAASEIEKFVDRSARIPR